MKVLLFELERGDGALYQFRAPYCLKDEQLN